MKNYSLLWDDHKIFDQTLPRSPHDGLAKSNEISKLQLCTNNNNNNN